MRAKDQGKRVVRLLFKPIPLSPFTPFPLSFLTLVGPRLRLSFLLAFPPRLSLVQRSSNFGPSPPLSVACVTLLRRTVCLGSKKRAVEDRDWDCPFRPQSFHLRGRIRDAGRAYGRRCCIDRGSRGHFSSRRHSSLWFGFGKRRTT